MYQQYEAKEHGCQTIKYCAVHNTGRFMRGFTVCWEKGITTTTQAITESRNFTFLSVSKHQKLQRSVEFWHCIRLLGMVILLTFCNFAWLHVFFNTVKPV